MGSIFHQKGRVSEQVCIEKMVNFPPCLLAWTIERRRRRRGVAFIWWAKLNPISPSGFTTEYLRKRFPPYLLYLIYRSSKLSRYLPILNSRTDIYGSRPTYAIFPTSLSPFAGVSGFIFYTHAHEFPFPFDPKVFLMSSLNRQTHLEFSN